MNSLRLIKKGRRKSILLLLFQLFLFLSIAAGGLYLAAGVGAELARQTVWRELAAGAAAGREVDKVPFAAAINAAAQQEGLDSRLVAAVIKAESSFVPRALSPAGAAGLMQVIPATWREVNDRRGFCRGRHEGDCGPACYFEPELNIRVGTAYLGELSRRYGGDMMKAVAAYNAGPAAVDTYGGLPPYSETREYVTRVAAYWYELAGRLSLGPGLPTEGWERLKRVAVVCLAAAFSGAAVAAAGLWRRHRAWRWR